MSFGNAVILPEHSLKFSSSHEDILNPKYGLNVYHPYDWNSRSRSFDEVRLGVICG